MFKDLFQDRAGLYTKSISTSGTELLHPLCYPNDQKSYSGNNYP